MSNPYLRALRSWWWLVVLLPLLAMGAAAWLTAGEPRVYRAAATATVAPAPEIDDASDVMRGLETLERRTVIATFASVAGSRGTQDSAAVLLGDPEVARSRYRVRASVVPSTNIIRVSVEGPEPERVSALANAAVDVLGRRAREMYRIFEIRPLESAVAPRAAIHPAPARNVTIAGIFGLFAGLLGALALERLRPSPGSAPLRTHSEAGRTDSGVGPRKNEGGRPVPPGEGGTGEDERLPEPARRPAVVGRR